MDTITKQAASIGSLLSDKAIERYLAHISDGTAGQPASWLGKMLAKVTDKGVSMPSWASGVARAGIGGVGYEVGKGTLGPDSDLFPVLEGVAASTFNPRNLAGAASYALRNQAGVGGKIFKRELVDKALMNVTGGGVFMGGRALLSGSHAVENLNKQLPGVVQTLKDQTAANTQIANSIANPKAVANPQTEDLNKLLRNIGIGAGVVGTGALGYLGYKAYQDHKKQEEDLKWSTARRAGTVNMKLPGHMPGMPSTQISIPASALPKNTYRKIVHNIRGNLREAEKPSAATPQISHSQAPVRMPAAF